MTEDYLVEARKILVGIGDEIREAEKIGFKKTTYAHMCNTNLIEDEVLSLVRERFHKPVDKKKKIIPYSDWEITNFTQGSGAEAPSRYPIFRVEKTISDEYTKTSNPYSKK